MLVDLDHPEFEGEIDAILDRARRVGVSTVPTVGTTLASFPRVLAIAERHREVFCTVGAHPHDAEAEACHR